MRPALTILPVLLAIHLSAVTAAAQVRVNVTNVPAGVSLQAVLNAANDSKPLTPAGGSGGTLSFSMLADAANFGKPVQVYLLKEEDDDDRPAGIFFVIDNGAVPQNARLVGSFTLTARTSEVAIDYQTGQVTTRESTIDWVGVLLRGSFSAGIVNIPNAGGGDPCSDVPAGSTLTRCELDTVSPGYRAMFGLDVGRFGVGIGYSGGGGVTLEREIRNDTNPSLTARQRFTLDPRSLELFGQIHHDVHPRVRLTASAGVAHVSAESVNTFATLQDGTLINAQTTRTDSSNWSPYFAAGATNWMARRVGISVEYSWRRLNDGDVHEPIHRFDFGVVFAPGRTSGP